MLGSLPGEERDLKGGQENQIIKKKKKIKPGNMGDEGKYIIKCIQKIREWPANKCYLQFSYMSHI